TQEAPAIDLKNDPPLIFTSNKPAILIHVDGEPVFGKIKDTQLEFIVNSNFPLFLDKPQNTYYLFTGERWLMTTDLKGNWSKATALPKDMSKLKADKEW